MQSNYFSQPFSQPYKSFAAAILLGLFLGPIGLLYGSFRFSVIVLLLCCISLAIPMGFFAILFFWVSCPYVNVLLVSRYNKKLRLPEIKKEEVGQKT
ncbi:MAG: hypothetical protein JW855_00730 [Gammaproteobacteria bacterium]|nr:hypothetical protein [Gammaproteobacteria bacterium]